MANLATYSDVEARLGITFSEAQRAQVTLLLQDASIAIRRYTNQDFSFVEDDVIILRPIGTIVRLPQVPVVSISGIRAISGYPGLPDFALAAWTFDGIDKVNLYSDGDQVVNYPQWWYEFGGANTYEVTYSHGYAGSEESSGIPDDVVAVACAMVMRVMTSPSQVGGMVSERIGQYFYQLQQNQGAAGASIRLTADDKAALSYYKKKATTIQVSV